MNRVISLLVVFAIGIAGMLAPAARAGQKSGVLYDPQPPADSAYLRILHLAGAAPLALDVGGRQRVEHLSRAEVSEYLVLPQGRHRLELRAGGRKWVFPAELAAGRAYTLALGPQGRAEGGRLFEDTPPANRLKALLSVYHLAPDAGPLDVATADGSTTVFGGLAPGDMRAVAVNPIEVDLAVRRGGQQAVLAHVHLAMQRGGAYSLFLLPGEGGGVELRAVQNRTERYRGR